MHWRKALCLLGVLLLTVVVCSYGAYRYLIQRYASGIDQMLQEIIASSEQPDTADDHPAPQPDTTGPPANSQDNTPTGHSPATTAEPDSVQEQPNAGNKPETPADGSVVPPPPDAPPAGTVEQITADLNLTADEQQQAASAPAILESMTLTEKLLVLKTLNHFTTSELLDLYRLYQQGDAESRTKVKQTLEGRFTEADLTLIKRMANKYR